MHRIARRWTARATPEGAAGYVRYFEETLAPGLAAIAGHLGALVMTGDAGGGRVEVVVETLWASREAIAAFAGADATRAVVEPEARALLEDFDDRVTHHQIRIDTTR